MLSKLLTTFSLLLVITTVNAEPVVAFNEKMFKAKVGETFTIDITVKDLPGSEGGGVSLKFDPKIIQATEVKVDTKVWDFASKNGKIDNKKGDITNILFAKFDGVSGNSKIATIKFKALKNGDTDLKLLAVENMPFASKGKKLAVKFKGAKVKVKGKPKNG